MRLGYTSIDVLQFLCGLPLDDLAYAYIHALRPSEVRVSTGMLKSDAWPWRVTVMTDDAGTITGVSQEVEVDLGERFQHGYALDCEMRARGKAGK